MCKAFSALVTKAGKAYWKVGLDSHDQIHSEFKGGDHQLQDTREAEPTFARVEIIPICNDYLKPEGWTLRIDESITPNWWSGRHENTAYKAQKEWYKTILNQINIKESLKPIQPRLIDPPKLITKKHLKLLREWISVRDSVWASAKDSISTSVWASARDSISASVGRSVRDSVWTSVRDSVWASVGASARNSVWASARDSVGAYIGSLFPKISKWEYTDGGKPPFNKIRGYPFESAVKLWKLGLIPSFDGEKWRLRGGNGVRVLWEGNL